MPKPLGTYLRTQAPTKVVSQAAQALALKEKVDADRRTGFAAALHAKRLDKKRLDDGRKLVEALKKFAKEPSTKSGELLKTAHEFIDLAQEVAELLAKMKEVSTVKEVHTLIGTARKMSDAQHKLDGVANAVHALMVAVAVAAFCAAVVNAAKKLGAKL